MQERKQTYDEFIQNIKESRENKWFEHSERHHIIPRCIGGTDEEDNLIYLTYREHFIAHKLLAEEHPENYKLTYAWNLMCNYRPEIVTPEEYEIVKRKFHDMLSKSMKGNTRGCKSRSIETRKKISESKLGPNNPMYGKTPSRETRDKLSESLKQRGGHPHTEETKNILSIKSKSRRFDKCCLICGNVFAARSNRTKYCDDCHNKYQNKITHGEFANLY